jgi:putative hemolysin
VVIDLIAILVLVLANGVFALSEIAVVSARKARLQQWAKEGSRRAAAALKLAAHPNDFLATVQVGITLVGICAGAFAGATVSHLLAVEIARVPALARWAEPIALALVVVAITYLSLILGELVPKRLALLAPERVALLVARPMTLLSRAAAPVVALLSGSTSLILRLLGAKASSDPPVTAEEIRLLVGEGAEAGAFERAEQQLIERVLRLDDRHLTTLMTPRRALVWLDVSDSSAEVARKVTATPFTRYPVARGELDDCLGYVHVRDLLRSALGGAPADLAAIASQPLLVPESTRPLALLERFRTSGVHIAFIVDEYGGIEGVVTLNDVLRSLIGDLPARGEQPETSAVRREDGSWLVDGTLPLDDLRELVAVPRHPAEEHGAFKTVGGLVMHRLGRIARTGDRCEWGGCRLEVIDLDGHIIDKVLVVPPAPEKE